MLSDDLWHSVSRQWFVTLTDVMSLRWVVLTTISVHSSTVTSAHRRTSLSSAVMTPASVTDIFCQHTSLMTWRLYISIISMTTSTLTLHQVLTLTSELAITCHKIRGFWHQKMQNVFVQNTKLITWSILQIRLQNPVNAHLCTRSKLW